MRKAVCGPWDGTGRARLEGGGVQNAGGSSFLIRLLHRGALFVEILTYVLWVQDASSQLGSTVKPEWKRSATESHADTDTAKEKPASPFIQ